MIPTNPASPLSDVFRCVQSIFLDIGNMTPVLIGKKHINAFGMGSGPKVIFVPDPRGKGSEVPTGMGGVGYVAGVAHQCDVYVRAAEDGSDVGRFDAVYALADLVINCLERAARGRIDIDFAMADSSPTDVDAYGADLSFKFTYVRGVQRNPRVWALPPNPIAPSPPDINRPPGTPASVVEADYTVTPQT